MATPATALLADFDFDLTSQPRATPNITRPPTPDPRRTPTPHPPRRCRSTLPTNEGRKRLRKKPTAIFVGSESNSHLPAYKSCPSEVKPVFDLALSSYHTLPSLLPLLPSPSTPSPRFASPSLSSSGTTVQSSPTLTPTTAQFDTSYIEPRPGTKETDVLSTWNFTPGKICLRRAKRLPRREEGLWEVHAVVNLGEESKDSASSNGIGIEKDRNQHQHYAWCMRQQMQAGYPGSSHIDKSGRQARAATATTPTGEAAVSRTNAAVREPTLEEFNWLYSESRRREGGLRKPPGGESSSLALSKYHFPAPRGDYRIGLSGDLEHPAKVHYRGASFDLVNPHASLVLNSSHLDSPAEVDGVLNDYFEEPDAMPRPLYTDPKAARRDIMRLDEGREASQAKISSNETSSTSLVTSTRPRSDPFDLRITDVPAQAAQIVHDSATGVSTIAEIYEDYDYTREAPFRDSETLRALESGLTASHSEEVFRQLPEEVQQHMSAELSEKASDMPTSERTYGDTGQLLGLTPRRPMRDAVPTTESRGRSEARMRPAPGRSTTETTMADSGLHSAAASLHGASSDQNSPESRSTQWARGDAQPNADYGGISCNTMRSDGEGDWETTRSESHPALFIGQTRPSEESYANTSTYSEANRLSAMSDATIAGKQSYKPYRAAHTLPFRVAGDDAGDDDEEDVEKASKALERIYKDKVLEQSMMAGMIGSRMVSKETHRKDRGILQGLRERRQSALLQARDNDIELEEIRKKNPRAVRLAADQLYAKNMPDQMMPQRPAAPMGRIRTAFSRNKSVSDQATNLDIMEDATADEGNRNLLAQTPTTTCSSRFAFSESTNTFRTFRDDDSMPSPLFSKNRVALDLGDRPDLPTLPAPAYTPDRGRTRRTPNVLESRHRERDKAPRRPARRAAMSSQTSLRALITGGSPTSNIQGAFTDREMAEASRRWDILPRHHNWRQRHHSRNASGPFPRLNESTHHEPNVENRLLLRPSEAMDADTQLLQDRLSQTYLMRILACPPLCVLYYNGQYDHIIAKQTNGRIKAMSPSKKDDALAWAVLITIIYCLIVVGIIAAVALAVAKRD